MGPSEGVKSGTEPEMAGRMYRTVIYRQSVSKTRDLCFLYLIVCGGRVKNSRRCARARLIGLLLSFCNVTHYAISSLKLREWGAGHREAKAIRDEWSRALQIQVKHILRLDKLRRNFHHCRRAESANCREEEFEQRRYF